MSTALPDYIGYVVAACRYATSRYPLSSSTVILSQDVHEKLLTENLIKHESANFNFELKMIAYRRERSESDDFRILLFMENSEWFVFFYDQSKWSATLVGCAFETKLSRSHLKYRLFFPQCLYKLIGTS